MSQKKPDMVNNPPHYKPGTPYEVIKVLRNWLPKEQFEGYLVASVIKYLARYRDKNGLEDVRKAQWYLNYLTEFLDGNGEDNRG